MNPLLPLLVATLLLAGSTRAQAAESSDRWNLRTTNWNNERKGDGYLNGTFLEAWLPGIFVNIVIP
jgi:hypothetical protein